MPDLVRLYIRHVLIGWVLSALFTALLLGLNVGNLWHLVRSSDMGLIAVTMLVVFNAIVFSGVQFAIAVMGMAESDGPKGGRRRPVGPAAVAPVRAESGGTRSNRAGTDFPRA